MLRFFKGSEVQVPRLFKLCAESANVSLSSHYDDLFHQAEVLLSSYLLSVYFLSSFLLLFSVILLFSPALSTQCFKITF